MDMVNNDGAKPSQSVLLAVFKQIHLHAVVGNLI